MRAEIQSKNSKAFPFLRSARPFGELLTEETGEKLESWGLEAPNASFYRCYNTIPRLCVSMKTTQYQYIDQTFGA